MTVLWIVLLGLVIGAVLGGLGGGGAILTVPVLVYVVDQSAQDATTSSLVIVGLTAAVGVISYVSSKRVRWGLGLTFGLVGFPATVLGSYLNHRVDENVLLLGFSVLMVVAATAMVGDDLRRGPTPSAPTAGSSPSRESGPTPSGPGRTRVSVLDRAAVVYDDTSTHRPSTVAVVAVALGVGLLTGFFGVGGGFVIVPALVLVLRLPIQQAVGTSLMIVALNSATSLVSRASTSHADWTVIVPFTLAAMAATLVGKRVADRLPARRLKVGFAALLALVAGYTAWQSIDGLRAADPVAAASSSSSSSAPSTAVVAPAAAQAALRGGAEAIDVRTPEEYLAGHLDGALDVDLEGDGFARRIAALPHDQAYVVYCASGNRAGQAIEIMAGLGFTDLVNGGGFVDLVASTSLPHS